jgi:iron complex transport system substrate-binding protein
MSLLLDRRRFSLGLASSLLARNGIAGAPRIACLDWALTETLLAIGCEPVAIVAASDWDRFVVEPRLPRSVADLGLQQEVNLELLASLRPDLILTSPFISNLDPLLERIARTVQVSIFEKTKTPLEHPRSLTRTLGEIVGRAPAARAFVDQAERTFDGYRARVAALPRVPVLLASFIDARHVHVYGGAGLFQNVLDRIGVENAWRADTGYWGFSTIGVERLAIRENARLVLLEPVPPDTTTTLDRSPLWFRLPFVKQHRITVLPTVFMFGALPSGLRFARLLVDALERAPG